MMTEPSGRGVRGMLNELLHGREDEHDDPAGGDGRDATDHDAEPGRYGAAPDPDAAFERPAPGAIGSGALATSGIGAGPRPVPRPGPPTSAVAGAHRLADHGDGDGSLFHGRDTAPTQAPTFGPRAEQRNWAGTGDAVPFATAAGGHAPHDPAEPQPAGAVDVTAGPDAAVAGLAATGAPASAENGRAAPLGGPTAAPHGPGPVDDGPGSAPDERPAAATSLPRRVVLGGHGRTGPLEKLLGGTAENLLNSLAADCMVVRS